MLPPRRPAKPGIAYIGLQEASGRGGNPVQSAPYESMEAWLDRHRGSIFRDQDLVDSDFRSWSWRLFDQMRHRGEVPEIDRSMEVVPPLGAAEMPVVEYPAQPLAQGDASEAWWSDIPGDLYARPQEPAFSPARRVSRRR